MVLKFSIALKKTLLTIAGMFLAAIGGSMRVVLSPFMLGSH